MENNLIEDEFEYEKINEVNGLKYKLQFTNQKVSEDPIIKKWLSSEKLLKGDNGIIACYCGKCHLFFYFQNENKMDETKEKCCDVYEYGYICNYCGKIYYTSSLCCIKNGIKVSFEEVFFYIEFNQII